jgi:hypothetical protein
LKPGRGFPSWFVRASACKLQFNILRNQKENTGGLGQTVASMEFD